MAPTNLLFINPSPMPYIEQKQFLDEGQTSRVPDFSVPLGIIELTSYLRQHVDNLAVELLDIAANLNAVYHTDRNTEQTLSTDRFYQQELDNITTTPDIVGISILYSTSYFGALAITQLAQKKWPDATIICGGNHASAYHKQMLSHPQIHWVFRGESEYSLVDFLTQFQQNPNADFSQIQGVYNAEKVLNETTEPERAELIDNLDEIGIPAFDLLNLALYQEVSELYDGISVMWSRGCPYKCTFCASHIVHGYAIRDKSNARIIEEVQHIKALGFDKITVYDDLFAARRKKFLALVPEMKESGVLENTRFFLPNSLSVGVLNEDVIDAIGDMGVQFYRVAIESGSKYTQDHIIDKHVNLKKCRRILQYIRTKDLPIEVNFILGFPGETKALMQETIDFIQSIDVDWVLINSALPLPGTNIFQEFIAMGVIDEDSFDWDMNRMPLRDFDTPEISRDELSQMVYDANIECNFFHNQNLKHGRYQRAIDYFNNMVLHKYEFHIAALYCRASAYEAMNKTENATQDFKRCVELIRENQQSREMYQRYSPHMPKLSPYFNADEDYLRDIDCDNVMVLPTSSGKLDAESPSLVNGGMVPCPVTKS